MKKLFVILFAISLLHAQQHEPESCPQQGSWVRGVLSYGARQARSYLDRRYREMPRPKMVLNYYVEADKAAQINSHKIDSAFGRLFDRFNELQLNPKDVQVVTLFIDEPFTKHKAVLRGLAHLRQKKIPYKVEPFILNDQFLVIQFTVSKQPSAKL